MPSIKELRSAVDKRNDGDEQQQVIQGFRNEERTTEMKDQLTTIFVSPDVDKAEKAAKYTGGEWSKLAAECKAVEEAISIFNAKIPDNKDTKSVSATRKCRDFESLNLALDEQKAVWQRNRWFNGQPHDFFNKICRGLDGHQEIFSAFPDDNIYTSVFCSVIKTVVKASQTYQAIAENIAEDVETINNVVHMARCRVRLWDNDYVLEQFAKLYSEIFLFYNNALDWYGSNWGWIKRMGRSLNTKYYERNFSPFIQRIKTSGNSIRDQAEVLSQSALLGVQERMDLLTQSVQSIRDSQVGLQDAVADIRGTVGQQRAVAFGRFEDLKSKLAIEEFEEQIYLQKQEKTKDATNQHLLVHFVATMDVQRDQTLKPPPDRRSFSSVRTVSSETSDLEKASNRRTKILTSTVQALEPFIIEHDDYVPTPANTMNVPISPDTFQRLQSWLRARGSASLCIIFPPSSPAFTNRSDSSAAAAAIVQALSQAPDLPAQPLVLFYFCNVPSYDTPLGGRERHEAGAVSMLYALIAQLVHSLPSEIDSSLNFSQQRFDNLDGTASSWAAALALFADLLAVALPYIFCVIDGLELLDYGSGERLCEDFVSTVWRITKSCESRNQVFKMLWTTMGGTQALSSLTREGLAHYEREPARRRTDYRRSAGTPKIEDISIGSEDYEN